METLGTRRRSLAIKSGPKCRLLAPRSRNILLNILKVLGSKLLRIILAFYIYAQNESNGTEFKSKRYNKDKC
jgi:hypothetical protein